MTLLHHQTQPHHTRYSCSCKCILIGHTVAACAARLNLRSRWSLLRRRQLSRESAAWAVFQWDEASWRLDEETLFWKLLWNKNIPQLLPLGLEAWDDPAIWWESSFPWLSYHEQVLLQRVHVLNIIESVPFLEAPSMLRSCFGGYWVLPERKLRSLAFANLVCVEPPSACMRHATQRLLCWLEQIRSGSFSQCLSSLNCNPRENSSFLMSSRMGML